MEQLSIVLCEGTHEKLTQIKPGEEICYYKVRIDASIDSRRRDQEQPWYSKIFAVAFCLSKKKEVFLFQRKVGRIICYCAVGIDRETALRIARISASILTQPRR